MSFPAVEILSNMPATCFIVVLCTVIWFYLWNYKISVEHFAFNYDRVIESKEYWRIITASFSHLHILHLVFNMSALYNIGIMESSIGVFEYLKYSFLLVILSMLTVIGIIYFMIHHFNRERYRNTFSLGYSCVVFGMMTIVSNMTTNNVFQFFGITIPYNLAPFSSLIITQLIIPNASLIGHLSGIILGYLISWHLFDWISNYFFFCLFQWFIVLFIWSLKTKSRFPLPFIKFDEEHRIQYTMINGVLVPSNGINQQRSHPLQPVITSFSSSSSTDTIINIKNTEKSEESNQKHILKSNSGLSTSNSNSDGIIIDNYDNEISDKDRIGYEYGKDGDILDLDNT